MGISIAKNDKARSQPVRAGFTKPFT